jgi:hypothetical protein
VTTIHNAIHAAVSHFAMIKQNLSARMTRWRGAQRVDTAAEPNAARAGCVMMTYPSSEMQRSVEAHADATVIILRRDSNGSGPASVAGAVATRPPLDCQISSRQHSRLAKSRSQPTACPLLAG